MLKFPNAIFHMHKCSFDNTHTTMYACKSTYVVSMCTYVYVRNLYMIVCVFAALKKQPKLSECPCFPFGPRSSIISRLLNVATIF